MAPAKVQTFESLNADKDELEAQLNTLQKASREKDQEAENSNKEIESKQAIKFQNNSLNIFRL